MSNSALVCYTKLSPNQSGKRNHAIDTITIHCVAGNASVEALGNLFADAGRDASSNYGIGSDGRIAMYVEEANRSWCTSSSANDNRAVTIEVANTVADHPWPVSDKAYAALIDLLTDICRRNGIKRLLWRADKSLIGQVDKQNMTVHRWFANKACPGDYLYERHGRIAEEVNKRLEEKEDEDMTPEKLAEMLPEAFAILAKKEAAPWAKKALDYCKENGYMVGDENGNQQPMKPLLRQEAAQIIMNIAEGKL